MFGVFSSLKSLISLNKIVIENGVFILHCKVTVSMLLVFTILIQTKQHFGQPIDCFTEKDDDKFASTIDSYCWIHSTFTVNELLMPKKYGKSAIQPGVGPHHPSKSTRLQHKYYQWVGFYLLFQAAMFYLPRFTWKIIEGGRLKVLTVTLDSFLTWSEAEIEQRKQKVVEYFLRNYNRNNAYAYRFIACEILNCANVCGQIFLTDLFLGFHFSSYGHDMIRMLLDPKYYEAKGSPMDKVFPKVGSCTFNRFGPTANIINQDVLCVLPLNILNEKIFIFLWFWFIFLAVVSLIDLIYRILTILIPSIRAHRLQLIACLCDDRMVHRVSKQCGYGDWFMLCLLGKNMDPVFYADIISELSFCFGSRYAMYGHHHHHSNSLGVNVGNGGTGRNHHKTSPIHKSKNNNHHNSNNSDETTRIEPVYDSVEGGNP